MKKENLGLSILVIDCSNPAAQVDTAKSVAAIRVTFTSENRWPSPYIPNRALGHGLEIVDALNNDLKKSRVSDWLLAFTNIWTKRAREKSASITGTVYINEFQGGRTGEAIRWLEAYFCGGQGSASWQLLPLGLYGRLGF
jgi:hypothetical protein